MKTARFLLLAAAIVVVAMAAALYVLATRPITVRGVIADEISGELLTGAQVRAGQVLARSDAQGRFLLRSVSRHSELAVTLDGYHPRRITVRAGSWFDGDVALAVSLQPVVLEGLVTDATSGQPLTGAVIAVGGETLVTGDDGVYRFVRVSSNADIVARADGYEERQLTFGGELNLPIALVPNSVIVAVVDNTDGHTIEHASISLDGHSSSDDRGRFILRRVKQQAEIAARADGYLPATVRYDGGSAITVALSANTLTGLVRDRESGEPLGGITVTLRQSDNTRVLPVSEGGTFSFRRVRMGAVLTAEGPEHAAASITYTGQTSVTLDVQRDSLRGVVRDVGTDQPVQGITVTLQQPGARCTAVTDEQGSFLFLRVPVGAVVSTEAIGYQPAAITYSGQVSVELTLRPNILTGLVRDDYSGQPMAGVTVTLHKETTTRTAITDKSGGFRFEHVSAGVHLAAEAPGYDGIVVTYMGQISLALSLRPNTLTGVVRDAHTGQPIAGAEVSVGSVLTKTAADGRYKLTGVPEGQPLVVIAGGYDPARLKVGTTTALDVNMQPFAVRGIYIPFYLLTVPERVQALISFAERAGMNAIVVDIKGDDGHIAYKSEIPLATEIGAQWPGKMMRLDEVLAEAKKRGMYTIARMVVFKDNVLALAHPDLAVRDKRTNEVWGDCGNGSTYWADPFRQEVIDYNVGIAEEAARMGFDEIQFDYIRFPPACVSRVRFENAMYSITPTQETRIAAIETFLAEARRRVKPLGVALAVDTFGWTLLRDDDMLIGQRMESMARYVDYICPMVYPSTWEPGAVGLDYVPAHPYEIVYESLKFGLARLKGTPGVKIRPWLQDFDDYQSKRLPYGVKELDTQRRAAADAGAIGWMLWNAGGVYTEETAAHQP